MAHRFIVGNKFVTANDAKEARALQSQFNELTQFRLGAEGHGYGAMKVLANYRDDNLTVNQRIEEMYREVDNDPIIERKRSGHQSTLMSLLGSAESVDVSVKEYQKRRVGEAGKAGVSMSGQTGIVIDHTLSDYQSAIMPVFDAGYGMDWRDKAADVRFGFDRLVDDAREIEDTVYAAADNFLWNGGSVTSPSGAKWNGLKGTQQGIASYTLTVNLAASATSGTDIANTVKAMVDVLKINNNCDGPFRLVVSREIMSNWTRYGSANDAAFGSIFNMIRAVNADIAEITEDPKLSGNQAFLAVFGRGGVSAKVGMAMSSYALPRFKHNDPFDFVKWMVAGFIAAETKAGYKCAVYASA